MPARTRIALSATLFAVLIAGCATETGYRERLAAWQGASEGDLVEAWGVPDGFYEAPDGARYLTYRRERTSYFPGTPGSTYVDPVTGSVQTVPGQPGVLRQSSCKTTFKIVDGSVESWRYTGNACVAR